MHLQRLPFWKTQCLLKQKQLHFCSNIEDRSMCLFLFCLPFFTLAPCSKHIEWLHIAIYHDIQNLTRTTQRDGHKIACKGLPRAVYLLLGPLNDAKCITKVMYHQGYVSPRVCITKVTYHQGYVSPRLRITKGMNLFFHILSVCQSSLYCDMRFRHYTATVWSHWPQLHMYINILLRMSFWGARATGCRRLNCIGKRERERGREREGEKGEEGACLSVCLPSSVQAQRMGQAAVWQKAPPVCGERKREKVTEADVF